HRHHTDLAPEVLGVGGDLLERIRGRTHQHRVHLHLMRADQPPELFRHRENDMEVRDRQQLRLPGLEPLLALEPIALRARTMATRVEHVALAPAGRAQDDLAPCPRGATAAERIDRVAMPLGHPLAVGLQVLGGKVPDDARHRRRHDASHVDDFLGSVLEHGDVSWPKGDDPHAQELDRSATRPSSWHWHCYRTARPSLMPRNRTTEGKGRLSTNTTWGARHVARSALRQQ